MFVNYVHSAERDSPINLAVARIVLGGWLIWKTIWYDWTPFVEAPFAGVAAPYYLWAVPGDPILLSILNWFLIVVLVAFIIGYRIRLTAALGALVTAYLGTVRFTLNSTGETEALFIGSFFLLFFALYAETDELSFDEWRRVRSTATEDLRSKISRDAQATYRAPALKWNLLMIAVIYFGSGFDKVFPGPTTAFATAENLSRIIVVRSYRYDQPFDLGLWMVDVPILIAVGAWGTLALELGFLLAVIAGVTVTPFILGFIGFTLANAVLLGIHFVDVYFILALFVAWDTIAARVGHGRALEVQYDDQCAACVRGLYFVQLIDLNETITVTPCANAAAGEQDPSIVVMTDGRTFEGYAGIRKLVAHFRLLVPFAWLMGLEPIKHTIRQDE